MAQTRKAPRTPSRKHPRQVVFVVLVPANWRPKLVTDVPPAYQKVDRAGSFPEALANELRREFNAAEIIARRHGRATNLWMIRVASTRRGGE